MEQRQDIRRESSERLFVQIVASNDPYLIGTTVSCKSIDTSASGLKIESSTSIPAGCQLDIWVDVSSKPGKFFLSSDVKWSKSLNSGVFHVGVEFNDGTATDINEWREMH